MYFWSLISNTMVTGMPIAWFISWLFAEHLFQFLDCGIHVHIPILTRVQKRHIRGQKGGHNLLKKMYFWGLIPNTMVTCMPIPWFILWLFIMNSFLFNSLVERIRTHIHILIVVQNARISSQKTVILCKKMLFLKLFLGDESHLYPSYFFYILAIHCKWFTFQFLNCGIRERIYIIIFIQKGHISG